MHSTSITYFYCLLLLSVLHIVSALQGRWKKHIAPSVAKWISALETVGEIEYSGDTDGEKAQGSII